MDIFGGREFRECTVEISIELISKRVLEMAQAVEEMHVLQRNRREHSLRLCDFPWFSHLFALNLCGLGNYLWGNNLRYYSVESWKCSSLIDSTQINGSALFLKHPEATSTDFFGWGNQLELLVLWICFIPTGDLAGSSLVDLASRNQFKVRYIIILIFLSKLFING